MMVNYYISRVHTYDRHRFCVAGTHKSYRYLLACPDSKVIVRGGFSTVLEAIRAAQREAVLSSIRMPQ